MNRNIYDTDCVTWSPQGRIFQIEYAAESVKLGTCAIALRGPNHAVLVALRKTVSKLAAYNSKIMKVDDHIGATFSGITADADLIVTDMRTQCLDHKYVYETPCPVGRVVAKVSSKSQSLTMKMGKRPYGVGLLVAGYDSNGPHVYETMPSGDYLEYHAQAFGSRCQSAKTYLEKNIEAINGADLKELLVHGLKAIVTTLAEQDLSPESLNVAVVGKETPFKVLEAEEIQRLLTEHDIKVPEADEMATD